VNGATSDNIERLIGLSNDGGLTDTEFAVAKRTILNGS